MAVDDQKLLSQAAVLDAGEIEDLLWALEGFASTSIACADDQIDAAINLSADRADRIRWHIVRLRDNGEVKRAERLFAFLNKHWPANVGFLTELLVINVLFEPRPEHIRPIAKNLFATPHVPSSVALLIAFDAVRGEDMKTARYFWEHVDKAAENEGPFKGIFRDTLSAIELSGLSDEERLVAFLKQSANYGNLPMAIRQAAFINRFSLKNPVEATSAALLAAQSAFDKEAMAHIMAFFSATRQDAIFEEIYGQVASDSSAWSIPQFAKWACLHAIRTGDSKRELEALTRYSAEVSSSDALVPFSTSAAQDEELQARGIASLATHAEPRDAVSGKGGKVFVGVFGQLRSYQRTLPALFDYFQDDLARSNVAYDIKLGLATWDKAGGRSLSIHDGIGFFKELMPLELHEIVDQCGAKDGSSLQRILPNVTQRLIELSKEIERPISKIEIEDHLPPDTEVRVKGDLWFQDEIKRQLPEVLPDMATHYLRGNMNQLRMWSRIAALGDIVRDQEVQSGERFDYIILVRSDLIIRDGSLFDLVSEAKSFETSVISDFDPHAEYIEGIGDRYFVGARNAIDPLFNCFDWLLEKVRTTSPSLIRLNPHEGASSVLFATGRRARPKTNIFYEIHRGRFPISSLTQAIVADVHSANERGMDGHLQQILSKIP